MDSGAGVDGVSPTRVVASAARAATTGALMWCTMLLVLLLLLFLLLLLLFWLLSLLLPRPLPLSFEPCVVWLGCPRAAVWALAGCPDGGGNTDCGSCPHRSGAHSGLAGRGTSSGGGTGSGKGSAGQCGVGCVTVSWPCHGHLHCLACVRGLPCVTPVSCPPPPALSTRLLLVAGSRGLEGPVRRARAGQRSHERDVDQGASAPELSQ